MSALIFGENETFRECFWNPSSKNGFALLCKLCFPISNFPIFSLSIIWLFCCSLNFNKSRRKQNFSFQKFLILFGAGYCTARRTSATLRGWPRRARACATGTGNSALPARSGSTVGYSDDDVFLENDRGSRV